MGNDDSCTIMHAFAWACCCVSNLQLLTFSCLDYNLVAPDRSLSSRSPGDEGSSWHGVGRGAHVE